MSTKPQVSSVLDRLAQASPATKVLLLGSLVFFVDSFLAWQKACVEVPGTGDFCASANAWHGVGVVAALLATAVLVLSVVRVAGVRLNLDRGVEAMVLVVLAGGTLLFTLIKLAVHDFRAYGLWIGLIAAFAIAIGGVMALGEANAAARRQHRRQRPADFELGDE